MIEEEQSWHPSGADLSPLALTGLLAVMIGPVILVAWMLLGLL